MPLVRDAIQQLGAAGSEIVTIFDFQDAFHTFRIALLSQSIWELHPIMGHPHTSIRDWEWACLYHHHSSCTLSPSARSD